MDFQTLLYEVGDDFSIITLNRPQRKNAISLELIITSKDAIKGAMAFLEKRDPEWSGE